MTLDELKSRCREVGDCWEWISRAASQLRRNHPQVHVGDKVLLVRRYAFEQSGRTLRAKRLLVPTCSHPWCVNPEHQAQMTAAKKSAHYAALGAYSGPLRSARNRESSRARAKLSAEQVLEIRTSAETAKALAARMAVSKSAVDKIRQGRIWRDHATPFAGLLR